MITFSSPQQGAPSFQKNIIVRPEQTIKSLGEDYPRLEDICTSPFSADHLALDTLDKAGINVEIGATKCMGNVNFDYRLKDQNTGEPLSKKTEIPAYLFGELQTDALVKGILSKGVQVLAAKNDAYQAAFSQITEAGKTLAENIKKNLENN